MIVYLLSALHLESTFTEVKGEFQIQIFIGKLFLHPDVVVFADNCRESLVICSAEEVYAFENRVKIGILGKDQFLVGMNKFKH